MKLTIIPAAILTLFATAAIAASPTFAEVDLDSDGRVTPAEFANALPDADADAFAAIDTDEDGTISKDEMAAATEEAAEEPKG